MDIFLHSPRGTRPCATGGNPESSFGHQGSRQGLRLPWRLCVFARVLPALLLFSGCSSEIKRGSAATLYTIADTLEVGRGDFGKNIQMKLDQKLFFNLEIDPAHPGHWELTDYDKRVLLLLNDSPRVSSGFQGFLLRARALGNGYAALHFVSVADEPKPEDVRFDISIRR